MGDPSPRCARRAEPQQCCESALDAFALAVPCGGCGVSSPTAAASTVSARRACQRRGWSARPGSERPRPRLQRHAPRLGGSLNTGGFPGRRVATRIRAAAASPFDLTEPPPDAMWPVVPVAGRLPARHRDDDRDSGTGLRLAAPTSASADYAACGSPVDGGTVPRRHESLTRKVVSKLLAATGPKAAFAACHYPFRDERPRPPAG